MSYDTLLFDVSDSVATISLNRPDSANALNVQMAEELLEVVIQCDADASIRAAVLMGEGKMFCAGGDVGLFASAGDQVTALLKQMTTTIHASISRMSRMDTPVVSAIHGACAGGAIGLGASADLVIAGESAKFTTAYTAIGVSPDGCSTYLLPRLIGLRKTQELFLTNRRIDAQEALAIGLVTEVVPDSDLRSRAHELAAQLAQGPTRAHGEIKRLLAGTFGNGMETQMELESRGIAALADSADGREGIAAFAAKRRPKFNGI